VGLTAETNLMTAAVPQVLFVLRPGLSDRNWVFSSMEQLHQQQARAIGMVVNGSQVLGGNYAYARREALEA
jgi:hypothetical protein